MTDARDAILARIRRANGAEARGANEIAALRHRLVSVPDHPIPARAQGARDKLVESFVAMAEEASAEILRLADPDLVPGAVADYLARHDLPGAVAMSPAEALDAYPWRNAPALSIRRGPAQPDDPVSVTPVFAAIAETGTLMVHSGAATPHALHFLPDTHIAILRADDIVGGYEEAWAALRARFAVPPRGVTLITGPSRSSDIERSLQIGVHGPRRLAVVLIDCEET